MADAGRESTESGEEARSTIVKNARYYEDLLMQHIDKEDNILYPMIDDLLTGNDEAELMEKFMEVEREQVDEDKLH